MRIAATIGALCSAAIAASFAAYQWVEEGAIDAVATADLGLTYLLLWLGVLLLFARC